METNLSNWREPEHVTWSFQNVDKILNTHPIHKGAKPSTLESEPSNSDDFKIITSEASLIDLQTFLTGTETDGIVVLKDGKIVYEHYDRTNTRETTHIMMSMTKSVAGLIAGILVDQGKLKVDSLVSEYVPEVNGTSYENVTVRNCLDMRAGIKYDDTAPEYRKAAGWNELEADEQPTNLHEFISKFQAPAGPKVDGLLPFEYISVNTDLMGWVLERASGKKFAELVSELIWQPMGAESDAYITVDSAGNARPAGGMCARVRDLARLCQLLVHDHNGIVPPSWIHDMINNGSREAFDAGPWNRGKAFGDTAYRSYWLGDSNNQALMGIGIHGQMMFVDRLNQIVMVKTSSQPSRFDIKKVWLAIKAFEEFKRILIGNSA